MGHTHEILIEKYPSFRKKVDRLNALQYKLIGLLIDRNDREDTRWIDRNIDDTREQISVRKRNIEREAALLLKKYI